VVSGRTWTTITFALARVIGRELKAGDEIVVTTLDTTPRRALARARRKGVVNTSGRHS